MPSRPRPQRRSSTASTIATRADGTFDLDYDRPKSIGRLRGFHGNYGVFVRSYAYILSLGADGLKVQEELMRELGLGQPEIAWHTMRDRVAEVGCLLGLVTGTLGVFDGSLTTLRPHETGADGKPNPTYRCLFPEVPAPGTIPACRPRRRSTGSGCSAPPWSPGSAGAR